LEKRDWRGGGGEQWKEERGGWDKKGGKTGYGISTWPWENRTWETERGTEHLGRLKKVHAGWELSSGRTKGK